MEDELSEDVLLDVLDAGGHHAIVELDWFGFEFFGVIFLCRHKGCRFPFIFIFLFFHR